jgi:hypothetical protein
MKTSNTVAWIVGIILLVALAGWAIVHTTKNDTTSIEGTPTSTSTPVTQGDTPATGTGAAAGTGSTANSTSGKLETYTNATYNFTINYPRELNAGSFGVFHQLNNNDWRVNATAQKRGTPVVAIPVFQVDNQAAMKKNYPLFFGAEVRVGVSPDTAQCYATDAGYANQTVTNVTINGVTWKKFIFGDAAMQQYLSGASYRTIHNNMCYVVEQVRTGSSYKDATLVGGYTDADLDAIYARTTPIVMSFKFTK